MGLDVAQLFARVGLVGKDQTVSGLQQVSRQVDTTGRKMSGLGSTSRKMAGGLVKVGAAATTVVAGGLVASAKAAIDWEDAFAGVRKTVDASESGFAQLSGDLRELATEIPISAVRLANLAEQAGALGVGSGSSNPLGAIKEFVRVTALLGETTDLSADMAAESLGHLSTVLGLTDKDYERFASTLVDLGNKGASTESGILGIAERAGAGAKLIGMAKSATLGWSSAVASLGIEVEAGGSALQTFFVKTTQIVAGGGAKLKTLAKVSGESVGAFKKHWAKDASGALQTFLVGLGKLDRDQQVLALKALGFSDIRITRMLLGLAGDTDKLSFALDTASKAWGENTALAAEAEKRFGTVKSKLETLRNNAIEAGIKIGEGMLPSLARFAEQSVKFLKDNDAEIKSFGADIGKALEGVDFGKILREGKDFVGLLKTAAGYTLSILDAVNQLPTEVKAAGAGLLLLNKASGGVVTDIGGSLLSGLGGGLLRGAANKVPGLNLLAATPVRVVNWPMGFGMGGPGAGGAPGAGGLRGLLSRGLLTGLLKTAAFGAGAYGLTQFNAGTQGAGGLLGNVGSGMLAGSAFGPLGLLAGGLVGAVKSTAEDQSAGTARMAGSIRQEAGAHLGEKSISELETGLAGIEKGIRDIESNPLAVVLHGDALNELKTMRTEWSTKLEEQKRLLAQQDPTGFKTGAKARIDAEAAKDPTGFKTTPAAFYRPIVSSTHAEGAATRRSQAATSAKVQAAARAAGVASAAAARHTSSSLGSKLNTSIGVQRGILRKRSSVTVSVRSAPVTLKVDGRQVASAMTKYGPSVRTIY